MKKITLLFALLLVSFSALAQSAYTLRLLDDRWPSRPFIVEIASENEAGISSFESYLENGEVIIGEDGNPQIGIVIGTVQRAARTKIHGWKFRIDPQDVSFSDFTIELCDGNFKYVEDNLEEWMRDVKVYCPWSTRSLVQEIRKGSEVLYRR